VLTTIYVSVTPPVESFDDANSEEHAHATICNDVLPVVRVFETDGELNLRGDSSRLLKKCAAGQPACAATNWPNLPIGTSVGLVLKFVGLRE
jgi:hypothetical protein